MSPLKDTLDSLCEACKLWQTVGERPLLTVEACPLYNVQAGKHEPGFKYTFTALRLRRTLYLFENPTPSETIDQQEAGLLLLSRLTDFAREHFGPVQLSSPTNGPCAARIGEGPVCCGGSLLHALAQAVAHCCQTTRVAEQAP